MSDLYDLHQHPGFESPVLVLALEGWIDAGVASATAGATLLAELDTEVVASFRADVLLDHRARRPILKLVDGVVEELRWPAIELRAGRDPGGSGVLLLVGAEPDHAWHAFTEAVVNLALEFDVRMVLGLGAYPAPAPHTRPPVLSCTASTPELAHAMGFIRGTLEVPAGVQAAIEQRAHLHGIPSVGVWAQVPHYAAGMPYPAAAQALIEGVNTLAGLTLGAGKLDEDAVEAKTRIDNLIVGNEEHLAMVRALEQQMDATPSAEDLPSGDEIAAELEKFLRNHPPGDT